MGSVSSPACNRRDAVLQRWRGGLRRLAAGGAPGPVPALLLLALTLAAYLPALRCGFIWDDDFHVQNNPTLRSLDGLRQIWFDVGATPQYYPLTHTTFWLEYHLWGLRPAGYHAVNILLHAVATLLLWQVLKRLRLPGAWFAAAVFGLHPVHVESVAWITERKNVLSAVFYLASAWAYLVHVRMPADTNGSERSGRRYLLSLFLFFLALCSKTVTCTLPAALLLMLWWRRGRIGPSDLIALAPFFVLGFVFGINTIGMERALGAVGEEWDFSLVERWLIAGRSLCFHAGKLLWPAGLTFMYPRWQIDDAAAWQYLFPAVVLGAIAALWLARHRIGRGPLVGILFFAGSLVPALGFFNVYPMRYTFVADHYPYLASLGLIALCVAGAGRLSQAEAGTLWHRRLAGASTRRRSVPNAIQECAPARLTGLAARLVPVTGAVLLVVLGGLTWRRQAAYADSESLWRDTIRKNPDAWVAHNHLGNILLARHRSDEAIRHFHEALRTRPDHADARNNLGTALASQGRFEEAIRQYRRALQSVPDSPRFLRNLGNALASSDRVKEALAAYKRALALRPDYAAAHYNLAVLLQARGRLEESIEHFRAAVRHRPEDAAARAKLAAALTAAGRFTKARPHLREAIRLRPDWPRPLNDLAWILATHPDAAQRRPREAVRLAERAAELTGRRDANVLDTLAAAYAAAGRFEVAVETARAAVAAASRTPDLAARIGDHLAHYRRKQPCPPPAPPRRPGGAVAPARGLAARTDQ